MAKTLCRLWVDPATKLEWEEGHVGLILTSVVGQYEIYQIAVFDQRLAEQILNHVEKKSVLSTFSFEIEEVETGDGEPKKMLASPVIVDPAKFAKHDAILVLFPQRAWVKRSF